MEIFLCRLRWSVGCALAVLLCGCNRGAPEGVAVTGTIQAAGEPLSAAVITLEPIDGTGGPNASAAVFDGRFEFAPDARLQGGRYLARVSMIPAEIRESIPPDQVMSMPPRDAMIDPRFDANSELDCELTVGQANRLEFSVDFLH